MSKLVVILLTSFFLVSASGQSNVLKDENKARAVSKKVADLFLHDSISYIFAEIQPFMPIPSGEIDNVRDKLFSDMETVRQRYGETIDGRKLKEEKISDFALRETYIIRYSNHAMRLIFTYYKNVSGWTINSFTWDDLFGNEFKE